MRDLAYRTRAREVTHDAARTLIQDTARALRKFATAGGHSPALVNAAAELERIYDSLYIKPVDDVPAPMTERSA